MHSFDRSPLTTGPCPAAPGGEFIVTLTPPRDVLREQLRVILYYRLDGKLWVVTHDDVRLSTFMAATCEQEVLGAELKGPEKPARWHDMLTTTWPGRVLAWIVHSATLIAAVAVAYAIGHDDDALRIAVVALVLLQVQRWAFAGVR